MQHELYYADLHLVAAVTQAALESWQHVNYDAVLDFVVVSASFDVVVELLFVF